MRRSITTTALVAAAVLALASCATPAVSTGSPSAAPADPVPTSASPSATVDHSQHTASEHAEHESTATAEPDEPSEPAGGHDHTERDDTYKDVKLESGTTYKIQSSTGATTFKLTIESFECKNPFPNAAVTASGKAAQFTADAGKTLCVAMVSGKNVGDKPDHAALNYFAVALVGETEYEETDSPDFTTRFLMGEKTPLDQPVDPGDTGWMALGYELPGTDGSVSLRIDTAPPSN